MRQCVLALLIFALAVISLLDGYGVIALPATLSWVLGASFVVLGAIAFFGWFAGYGNRDAIGPAGAAKSKMNG